MISFKIDWFDLLTVKGLQESSPAPKFNSINSLVFCLLSQLDVTTGKTTALTICTFVGRVMLFNTLSRFVITFLPRSNCLLIPWMPSSLRGSVSQNKALPPTYSRELFKLGKNRMKQPTPEKEGVLSLDL